MTAGGGIAAGWGGSPIGPGRLVLVIGPSGAGKDTLIAHARAACSGDPRVVFPLRIVTRPATVHEEHLSVSHGAFDRAARDGAFAFWWSAHGLKYALPRSVEADIGEGRTVVCNVSRTIVADLRERYARLVAVLVTAPPAVLAERLQARGRPSDGAMAERIARSVEVGARVTADVIIQNVGTPAAGAVQLLAVIRSPAGIAL